MSASQQTRLKDDCSYPMADWQNSICCAVGWTWQDSLGGSRVAGASGSKDHSQLGIIEAVSSRALVQHNAGHSRAGQGKAGQGPAEQRKAGQGIEMLM